MAISSNKYVNISTSYPILQQTSQGRSGLVITGAECSSSVPSNLQDAYKALMGIDGEIGVVGLDEEGVKLLFGAESTEYKFALNYYSYISPSGNMPAVLYFSRIAESETLLAAFQRAAASGAGFYAFTFLSLPESEGSSASGGLMAQFKDVAAYNQGFGAKYNLVVNMPQGESYGVDAVVRDVEAFSEIVGVTFVYGGSEVSAYMPMAISASTNYEGGTVAGYMFKQFANETPIYVDDAQYEDLLRVHVNFYGLTQVNGSSLSFYQPGFNTDGMDSGVYANECWFKAVCEQRLIELEVQTERIPADDSGRALVEAEVIRCCGLAVNNGMFARKDYPAVDLAKVRSLLVSLGFDQTATSADVGTAILQNGYYISTKIASDPGQKVTIHYIVFYGTAESIRYIRGANVLTV